VSNVGRRSFYWQRFEESRLGRDEKVVQWAAVEVSKYTNCSNVKTYESLDSNNEGIPIVSNRTITTLLQANKLFDVFSGWCLRDETLTYRS
jgi:hypothetical protein